MYFIAIKFVLHLTEKQRQASLRYTKNRLFANDIISSYLMLHSIWIIPIANVVNFIIIPIALHYYTTMSFSEISFVSVAWLIFQPIYGLMLVKLWDLAEYSIRILRRCAYFTFKKDLMNEMIELRKDILSHISSNLLKTSKTSKEELPSHSHRD